MSERSERLNALISQVLDFVSEEGDWPPPPLSPREEICRLVHFVMLSAVAIDGSTLSIAALEMLHGIRCYLEVEVEQGEDEGLEACPCCGKWRVDGYWKERPGAE